MHHVQQRQCLADTKQGSEGQTAYPMEVAGAVGIVEGDDSDNDDKSHSPDGT